MACRPPRSGRPPAGSCRAAPSCHGRRPARSRRCASPIQPRRDRSLPGDSLSAHRRRSRRLRLAVAHCPAPISAERRRSRFSAAAASSVLQRIDKFSKRRSSSAAGRGRHAGRPEPARRARDRNRAARPACCDPRQPRSCRWRRRRPDPPRSAPVRCVDRQVGRWPGERRLAAEAWPEGPTDSAGCARARAAATTAARRRRKPQSADRLGCLTAEA